MYKNIFLSLLGKITTEHYENNYIIQNHQSTGKILKQHKIEITALLVCVQSKLVDNRYIMKKIEN